MIHRLGKKLSALAERFMPDPFVLAILLTFVTIGLSLLFGDAPIGAGTRFSDLDITDKLVDLGFAWFESFYQTGLMKFALQMCIVLITGHALATSQPVQTAIKHMTGWVRSPAAAASLVALVACLASLVQWGLGAIAGAFMAREMGRSFALQGRSVHYPVLGAAGYAGFLVWHGGLSGTAPLKVAEPGHFLEPAIGVISIDQTILSATNFAVTGSLLVIIPIFFWFLMPREEGEMVGYTGSLEEPTTESEVETQHGSDGTIGLKIEQTRILNAGMGGLIVLFLGLFLWDRGVSGWNLDSINLMFLALGMILHRSPIAYAAAFADGVRGAAGIILQFPFYFGILGLLKSSGLIVLVAQFFVDISTETTLPVWTFLSAGLVNLFVPSGGGQWAVQGPVMMEAVKTIGGAPQKVILALSYGDAWTNMLQPFWALPLLGIMGLRARDIMGYTSLLLLLTGPVFIVLLLLL
jgi:short-chain fatty acids transporter